MKPIAILWDYDGTLMDSMQKNFSVNREIFQQIKPEVEVEHWPAALSSLPIYKTVIEETLDWKRLYIDHFGLTYAEAMQAGGMWSEFNATNKTTATLFKGIPETIQSFKEIPQGICSLNSSDNISKMLQENKIAHCFSSIVGFDSISLEKLKPYPDAFLHCLETMQVATEGVIFYIGDHQDDTRFARNAELALQKSGKDIEILSIAAAYGGARPDLWEMKPDYTAHSAAEIKKIINY